MGGKQQKEEKEMIEELKERIYGWDKDYNDGTFSCYGVDEYGSFYKVEK